MRSMSQHNSPLQDLDVILFRLNKLLGNVIISQGGVGELHILLMIMPII